MNYIKNDLGKPVVAVGMEGSDARLKVQFPFLLSLLRLLDRESDHQQVFADHDTPQEYRKRLSELSRQPRN
jgi:hypothetical protein